MHPWLSLQKSGDRRDSVVDRRTHRTGDIRFNLVAIVIAPPSKKDGYPILDTLYLILSERKESVQGDIISMDQLVLNLL